MLSDVDGTLVTNDKVLTEDAIDAVRALKDVGIAFSVTSSRPPRGMSMLVEPLGLTLPLGGCNGGALVEPDMTAIQTLLIDAEAARKIVAFFEEQGLDVWVYSETRWMVQNPNGPHVARERFILQFDAVVVPEFTDAHLTDAVKIVGVSDDFPLVAECEKAAQALLGETASATRSAPHFIDVTNPLANKGQMVHTLAKLLGISPAEIATIGDMENDVLMFRQSGFSIAMGNASDEVKARATVATESNQDDGFAKAVRKFLLQADAA